MSLTAHDRREFEHACKLAKPDPMPTTDHEIEKWLRGWRNAGAKIGTKRTAMKPRRK